MMMFDSKKSYVIRRTHGVVRNLLHLAPGDHYVRCTVRESRNHVASLTPFIAGKETLFGRWEYGYDDAKPKEGGQPYSEKPVRYVAYSYGTHFPMYIYDPDTRQWYGNKDKYSRTTSRHQAAARPLDGSLIIWLDSAKMDSIARYGVFATVCDSVGGLTNEVV